MPRRTFRYPTEWTQDACDEYAFNIECGETHERSVYRALVVQSETYMTENATPW